MIINKILSNISTTVAAKANSINKEESKVAEVTDNTTAKIYDYENKENRVAPQYFIPNMVSTGFGSMEPKKQEEEKTSQSVMASNGFLNLSYSEMKKLMEQDNKEE